MDDGRQSQLCNSFLCSVQITFLNRVWLAFTAARVGTPNQILMVVIEGIVRLMNLNLFLQWSSWATWQIGSLELILKELFPEYSSREIPLDNQPSVFNVQCSLFSKNRFPIQWKKLTIINFFRIDELLRFPFARVMFNANLHKLVRLLSSIQATAVELAKTLWVKLRIKRFFQLNEKRKMNQLRPVNWWPQECSGRKRKETDGQTISDQCQKKLEIPLIHFNKWISPQRKLEIWKFSKRLLTSNSTWILCRNANASYRCESSEKMS